jgi:hypothetical protein
LSDFLGADANHEVACRIMMDSMPEDWDKRPVLLALEIRNLISSMKDEGTAIDSGTDGASGDLWVTVQGVEYYINIRKLNNQIAKEEKEME